MLEVCTDPAHDIVDFMRYAVTDSWPQGDRQRNMCLALNQYQYPVDTSDFPDYDVTEHLIYAHWKVDTPDKSGVKGKPHMPNAALCYTLSSKKDRSWKHIGLPKAQQLMQIIGLGGNGSSGGRAVMLKMQEIASNQGVPIIVCATPNSAPFYDKMGFESLHRSLPSTFVLVKVWGKEYIKH